MQSKCAEYMSQHHLVLCVLLFTAFVEIQWVSWYIAYRFTTYRHKCLCTFIQLSIEQITVLSKTNLVCHQAWKKLNMPINNTFTIDCCPTLICHYIYTPTHVATRWDSVLGSYLHLPLVSHYLHLNVCFSRALLHTSVALLVLHALATTEAVSAQATHEQANK